MSGAFWRGTHLRLAEAKPRWDVRYVELLAHTYNAESYGRNEKERNPSPEVVQAAIAKKRKRSAQIAAREGLGKETQDMRLPTESNYAAKKVGAPLLNFAQLMKTTMKFWKITLSHHLIRPLSMRPCHPLLPRPSSTSVSNRPRTGPSRGRRRVIDPSLWNPTHLSEPAFPQEQPPAGLASETWEYHSENDEGEEGEPAVGGIWRKVVDGKVVDEEVVPTKRRRSNLELEEYDEPDGSLPSYLRREKEASPLFASERVDKEISPLFGNRTASASTSESSEPPLLGLQQSASASAPSSPLFPIRQLPASESNAPDSIFRRSKGRHVGAPIGALPAPLLDLARKERSAALDVLETLLGDVGSVSVPITEVNRKRNDWAGFEESDEEDGNIILPLRLRGGAGAPSSDSVSGSEVDHGAVPDRSSSSDEDDDSDSTEDEADSTSANSANNDRQSVTAKSNTLKSLFDPSSFTTGQSPSAYACSR